MAQRPTGFGLGMVAGALLAGVGGALLMQWTAPSVAPPSPAANGTAERGLPTHQTTRGSSSSGPGPSGVRPSAPPPVPPAPVAALVPTDTDAALSPEEVVAELTDPVGGAAPRDPAARKQWLEDNVMLLVTSVAPELDGAEVTRDCTPDGAACTIEGPWPGDDFLGRWLDAISDGVIAPGDLSGVTFSRFENVEDPAGEAGFRITAHAPR